MSLETIGKFLVGAALVLLVTGGALYALGKVLGVAKLPGDILYRRGNVTVFFPIVTMIVLSIVLTVILNLVFYFMRGRR